MHHVELKRHMGAADIAAVSKLLDLAAEADGHRPLGEHQWLDLVHGGRKGFAGLVAWQPGLEHPVGYAQVTGDKRGWAVELVVSPQHRNDPLLTNDLLQRAIDVVREEGGGHLQLWVPKATEVVDRIVSAVGLGRGRDLLQMRRPLPVDEPFAIDVRPFVVGLDEEAWLDVNNRAFAWHPEQGTWDLDTLRRREAEPWFDANGFLVHEIDGRLAGFCWTKVHLEERLGEIYVIAVDPDHAGKGLGRALVLAGLDHLHRERGMATGMLYVDATNVGAVHLYAQLGFTVDHVDRAYTGEIA